MLQSTSIIACAVYIVDEQKTAQVGYFLKLLYMSIMVLFLLLQQSYRRLSLLRFQHRHLISLQVIDNLNHITKIPTEEITDFAEILSKEALS